MSGIEDERGSVLFLHVDLFPNDNLLGPIHSLNNHFLRVSPKSGSLPQAGNTVATDKAPTFRELTS